MGMKRAHVTKTKLMAKWKKTAYMFQRVKKYRNTVSQVGSQD
jgi:hypothetical protein